MIGTRTAFAALAVAAAVPAHAAIVISTAATQNMSCGGGVCAPTATDAVLNVTDLENDLSQFGNITVMTTGNGVEANNIVVKASFSSPNSTSLTLNAHHAITVDAAVSIGSGTAELELQTDGQLAALSFGRKGHITFGSLSDIFGINGGVFTLVGSVQGLASAIAANAAGAYALANNYDANKDGAYPASPIATTVMGVVEGLGNTVSNLSIKHKGRPGHLEIAMFYAVGSNGSIENLRLSGVSYSNANWGGSASGLVGSNDGYLFGDSVSGSVSIARAGYAAGLVVSNRGVIASSSASVNTSSGYAGDSAGLVAGNSGTISLSHADVDVSAAYIAGGLVILNEGTISLSYASGNVSNSIFSDAAGGGLAGENYGSIDQSFAMGDVSAVGPAGGLVGASDNEGAAATITDSYSMGAVTSSGGGGLVGTDDGNHGTIATSYSSGLVSSGDGGFACKMSSTAFTHDYWDTTTSGTTYGACSDKSLSNVTGLTSQQLQSGLPAGFDPKIWAENPNINGGLPYLIHNPPPK